MDDENKPMFVVDSELFTESLGSLEDYKQHLMVIYNIYAQDQEVPKELSEEMLYNLEEQIEAIDILINSFRNAIRKTIFVKDDETPTYH